MCSDGACLRERTGAVFVFSGARITERRLTMGRENESPLKLSEKEDKMIRLLRKVEFGEIRIILTDGQPVRIEEVRRSIKL